MTAKRALAVLALAAASAALAAACTETTQVRPRSEARAQGIFSTRLPTDRREQMRLGLEQDARRREERFADAANPLSMWKATRVFQYELEAGRFTPDETFQLGAQLFYFRFTKELGLGGADRPGMWRFHKGARGGPDAYRCADCHHRGGIAGGGDASDNAYLQGDGDAQSTALARNPITLVGAGFVELLAREITVELGHIADGLADGARRDHASKTAPLVVKGIDFGALTVRADGTRDTSQVKGVDGDLVVRPFGHKGTFSSLRDAIEDELATHHGMQTNHLARTGGAERVGPRGGNDPDGDGVTEEISEGQLSALTFFVAMQEVPVVSFPPYVDGVASDGNPGPVREQGKAAFAAIGCASCHVPSVPLGSTVYRLDSREGGKAISIDLAKDGAEPRLAVGPDGAADVPLYSDLKRHDMGPELAEGRPDRGVAGAMFLTRPLWGAARSRPYLHDARAPAMEDAIRVHGGEAAAARDAYLKLDMPAQRSILVFLMTMTRARRFTTQ